MPISAFPLSRLSVVTNTNLCFSHMQFPFSCFVTTHMQLIHRKSQLRPKMSLTFKWMDNCIIISKGWAERESVSISQLCILQAMSICMLHKTWGQCIIEIDGKIHIITEFVTHINNNVVLKVKTESKRNTNQWHQQETKWSLSGAWVWFIVVITVLIYTS